MRQASGRRASASASISSKLGAPGEGGEAPRPLPSRVTARRFSRAWPPARAASSARSRRRRDRRRAFACGGIGGPNLDRGGGKLEQHPAKDLARHAGDDRVLDARALDPADDRANSALSPIERPRRDLPHAAVRFRPVREQRSRPTEDEIAGVARSPPLKGRRRPSAALGAEKARSCTASRGIRLKGAIARQPRDIGVEASPDRLPAARQLVAAVFGDRGAGPPRGWPRSSAVADRCGFRACAWSHSRCSPRRA